MILPPASSLGVPQRARLFIDLAQAIGCNQAGTVAHPPIASKSAPGLSRAEANMQTAACRLFVRWIGPVRASAGT